ncbi:hypothetical protein FRB99_005167 [Tulasnella sp. 403]|nr:hypothetical protein FRB99_005167 [Tulasnella sp. 403]
MTFYLNSALAYKPRTTQGARAVSVPPCTLEGQPTGTHGHRAPSRPNKENDPTRLANATVDAGKAREIPQSPRLGKSFFRPNISNATQLPEAFPRLNNGANNPRTSEDEMLNHLRQLHEVHSESPTTNLESLWHRWLDIREHSSRSRPSYVLSIISLFVRLAGTSLNPILLATISHFLKRYPEMVPDYHRIVRTGSSDSNGSSFQDSLAVEWAIAETSMGTADWKTILQSLRRAGLASDGYIPDSAMTAFASEVIECWLSRRPLLALDLYQAAQEEGIALARQTSLNVTAVALNANQYRMALDILDGQEQHDEVSINLTQRLVNGLSSSGLVSLPQELVASLSRLLLSVIDSSLLNPTDVMKNRQHWEWCLLILSRSRSLDSAYHAFSSLPQIPWSPHFLRSFCAILCQERQYGNAADMCGGLQRGHSLFLNLNLEVFRHAARAGFSRVSEECWKRLKSLPTFIPTQYDHLLWRYALRERREGKRLSPLPITRNITHTDSRTVHLGFKMLVSQDRRKLAQRTVSKAYQEGSGTRGSGARRGSGAAVDVNAMLSAWLPKQSPRATAEDVYLTFCRFLELRHRPDDAPSPLREFQPDLVTLNILIKAWLRLREVDSTMIRSLVDQLVSVGYPTCGIELPERPGYGLVFGTPLPGSRPYPARFVDMLTTKDAMQSLSYRTHVIPLYKMVMKAFYVRRDIESARTIVYMYKRVRSRVALADEEVLRHGHLERLSRRDDASGV